MLDPAGLVAFQLPKAVASRAFEWLIVAALAFAFARDGRAIFPRHRLNAAVVGVVVVAAISSLFAADRFVAVFGDAENYQGFTFLVDMALLYAAVAVAVRGERDVFMLLGAASAAGVLAIAYGFAQSLGVDPFAWAADPRARPFATFGNPDHFGHFLSVLFGIALGLAVATPDGRVRAAGAAGALLTLGMSAIVATRATVLGIGAALIAAAAVRRPTARSLIVGAGAIVIIGAALAPTPLGQRFTAGGVVNDRLQLWGIALRASVERPILGYGPDNFRAAFATHRTVESLVVLGDGPQSTAHDWILDTTATTGLVGLAVLIALIAFGSVDLWRLAIARPAVGVPLALGWVAYWGDGLVAASSLAAVWYPWVALGAVVALRGARGAEGPKRQVPRWAVAILTLIALVGAASGARALQANRDAWTSEEAMHFGDRDAALTFADRAAARDGGRADNWNSLAIAFEVKGRRAEAVDAYREATRRGPYEAVYWANLARAIARIAGTDAAPRDESLAAARQATIVDPNAPVGHVALAEVAMAFGHCDVARAEAARAAALQAGHDDLVQRAASCR